MGGGSSSDNVGPMNLLNIRKVGYGVRSIDELRAPGSRVEPQPVITEPAADPHRSILEDARFNSPTPASHADDRFAATAEACAEGEISEQNVERVIRQVLERLGK
ncbi:acetaldehyde dehydrogenase (acetylating) [Kluyvera intermedia]|nr:acetaldehyde dehydrogenase (acetylating) [Kluyvera intermedia]